MLKASPHVSDLIFSPGRAPQIEVGGQLVELKYKGLECLTSQDTNLIANDIMGKNETPIRKLEQEGSADLSYGLAGVARFRVNVFRQRGSCAIVMRVIPDKIPGFAELNLPAALGEIVDLRNGIVLVTGPTGSGKSSTLAAILDKMNEEKPYHILTIEDPIEFLHRHKKATIHQRELHSDTPSFALALRAALRQAPKVILVGEMRDRETIEIALEVIWCCPRCTRLTLPKPSSASSEFFPSETSRRSAGVSEKHSALSFRSVCFPPKADGDASLPSRS